MNKPSLLTILIIALSGCASYPDTLSDSSKSLPSKSSNISPALSQYGNQESHEAVINNEIPVEARVEDETDYEGEGMTAFKVVEALKCQAVPKSSTCKSAAPMEVVPYQITFENNKAALTTRGKVALKKLATEMTKVQNLLKQYSLMIAGHTDSRGRADYNRWLSEKRAETVRNYLSKELGISPNRFIVQGYGKNKLIYSPDDTPQKRAKNRRVEFKLLVD